MTAPMTIDGAMNGAARTLTDLWDTIRDAINDVTPKDCTSFFTALEFEPE